MLARRRLIGSRRSSCRRQAVEAGRRHRRCARCRRGTRGRCCSALAGMARRGRRWPRGCPRRAVPFASTSCGKPFGPRLEVAVRDRSASSGTSNTSVSTSRMPSIVARLRLHLGPVADVADVVAGDAGRRGAQCRRRAPGRSAAGRPCAVCVLAQEHLVRRMRRVGLVLVDPRRRGVRRFLDVVGRAEDAVRARLVRARGSSP